MKTHPTLLNHLIFSLSLVMIMLCALPTRARAATATNSGLATDSATKSLIKEQVEKAIKQQATDPQVKGMVDRLKTQKFGVIGTLEKIVGSSLQVRSIKGTLKLIELDRGVVILKDSRQITKEDLELNIPVIVMGYREGDQSLLARRIIIADDSILGTKKDTTFGKVREITPKLITTLTYANGTMILQPIKLSSKSVFLNSLGSVIKRTEIKVSDPVIAVFAETQIASASAVRVYSLSPAAVPSPTLSPLSN